MCEYPSLDCPFCVHSYLIDKGVISMSEVVYQSGDSFWGCLELKVKDDKSSR